MKSMTTRRLVAGISATALIGAFAISKAQAATDTANMNVTAAVVANCDIRVDTHLAFGSYDPLSATNLDQTAAVGVRCTKGTPNVEVTLGLGGNAAGAQRQMNDAVSGDDLAYDLYTDAARTNAWGDTVGTGVGYVAATANWQSLTVYGRVPAGQDVSVGNYTDTVVATINF